MPSWRDLRLFSAGGGGDLAEWDIEHGSIRVRYSLLSPLFFLCLTYCRQRTIPSHGGSIWSISPNPSSTLLALGCEDGSVRILSLDNDTLIHHRRLDRVKCRILSLAWGPPTPRDTTRVNPEGSSSDDEDDDWSDSWIVAGCSDSCLRKWDVSTGRLQERMGTDKLRGEKTLVWTVGVLG